MTARFSIGIDLGTTSSALAYVPLTGDAQPEALAVSQWETPDTLVEAPTLPSFLYLPEDAFAAQLRGKVPGTQGWIAGRLARRTGRRNARPRRPVGKVLAVSPRGRPVRADPALGVGGSCAGAKDLARPSRRVHPELSAGRLGQQLRPIGLRVR